MTKAELEKDRDIAMDALEELAEAHEELMQEQTELCEELTELNQEIAYLRGMLAGSGMKIKKPKCDHRYDEQKLSNLNKSADMIEEWSKENGIDVDKGDANDN